MSKSKNVRSFFNQIVNEVSDWRKDDINAGLNEPDPDRKPTRTDAVFYGQHHYHFNTPDDDPNAVVHGKSPLTRVLANSHTSTDLIDPTNPQSGIKSHPFARDLKHLHDVAMHYESRLSPLHLSGKHPAHAMRSKIKWSGHLNRLHNDTMRAMLEAEKRGHSLPIGFKGLTDADVAKHAKDNGIDISKPFDYDGFLNKIADLRWHNATRNRNPHPLYAGWSTPTATTEAPKIPDINDSMNTNNFYRQGLRALFESVLDEAKKAGERVVHRENPKLKYLSPEARRIYRDPLGFLAGNRQAQQGTVVGAAQNIVGAASQEPSKEDKELQTAWQKTAKEKFEPREDSSHNIRKAFQSILSENDLWRAKRNVHRDVVNAARGDKNALSNLKSHASGRELVNTYHKLHADFKDLNLKRGMSEDEAHMGAHHEASAEVERLVSDHGYHDPSKPFEGMPRAK